MRSINEALQTHIWRQVRGWCCSQCDI